jgi:hypothetical protein
MVRRDLPNKQTEGNYQSVPKKPVHIDPDARHPALVMQNKVQLLKRHAGQRRP